MESESIWSIALMPLQDQVSAPSSVDVVDNHHNMAHSGNDRCVYDMERR